MEQAWPDSLLQNSRTIWVIAALMIVLFLATNLPWNLDDYDQAKQAFTSFEMIKEGHWLYQRTPHERIATKPPLVGWFSAGVFELTRSWEIAWRLPSLLAAGALSILLFRAANSAYGPIAGVIALSAFSFNLLTPRLATLVRTDMPLALVVFLIGLSIWQKIRKNETWSFRERLWTFGLLTIGTTMTWRERLPRSCEHRLSQAPTCAISRPPTDGIYRRFCHRSHVGPS